MACLIVLSGLPVATGPVAAEGHTIVVTSGEDIQSAVDDADPGDTVVVEPGTYDQSVTIRKNVTLRASGDVTLRGKRQLLKDGTVTQGNGPRFGIRLTDGADGATVEGFTINYFANGILVGGADNVTITGTTIRAAEYGVDDTTTTFQTGITVSPGAGATVRNLTIADNDVSRRDLPQDQLVINYDSGVVFRPVKNTRYEDLQLTGNSFSSGLSLRLGGGATVQRLAFERNDLGTGTYSDAEIGVGDDFSTATVRELSIRNNTGNKIELLGRSGTFSGVVVRDNENKRIDLLGDGADITDVRVADNELEQGVSFNPGGGARLSDVVVRNNTMGTVDVFKSGGGTYEDITLAENDLSEVEVSVYGGTVRNVTTSRNTITAGKDDDAIFFSTAGGGTTVDDVEISDNDIRVTGPDAPEALEVFSWGGDTWTDFNVSGNVIDARDAGEIDREDFNGGSIGVYFGVYDGIGGKPALNSVRFTGNTFRGTNTSLYFEPIDYGSYDITIADNTIIKGDFGVLLYQYSTGGSGGQLTIEQNIIDNIDGRGVGLYGRFNDSAPADTFPEQDPSIENAPVTVEIRRNQISNNVVGVELTNIDPGGVTVRRNNFLLNEQEAVLNEEPTPVDARYNHWNASDGPTSTTADPLADPVETERLANGSGQPLPPDPDDPDLAAVRFVPFIDAPIDLDDPATPAPPDEPDDSESEDESDEPVIRDDPEPRFEYEGTVNPTAIDPGERVWVNVTVRNEGDAAGQYDGVLGTGFVDLAERPGRLAPGESRELRYRVSFDEVSINQLFVDGAYIGKVRIRQPTPAELSQRHLEVEAAYATRLFVSGGSTYEAVAVVQNTDEELHEFQLTFDSFRTTTPTESAVRTTVKNRTILLEAGKRRVIRQELTATGGVPAPRRATTFLNGVPVGNLTVLPSSPETPPHGVTTAYTTAQPSVGDDYEVVAVVHNANATTENFMLTTTDPRFDPEAPFREQAKHIGFHTVTVPPGKSKRFRIQVGVAQSNTGIGHWEVNGIPATVVGQPDEEASDA